MKEGYQTGKSHQVPKAAKTSYNCTATCLQLFEAWRWARCRIYSELVQLSLFPFTTHVIADCTLQQCGSADCALVILQKKLKRYHFSFFFKSMTISALNTCSGSLKTSLELTWELVPLCREEEGRGGNQFINPTWLWQISICSRPQDLAESPQ